MHNFGMLPAFLRTPLQSIILLSALILPSVSYADFIIHSWQDHHEVKSGLQLQALENYYFSTANFDAFGNSSVPSGFQNYSRFQTDLVADYGLFEGMTLFGRVSWAYTFLNGTINPGVGYGFADQTVGANYRVIESHSKPHAPPTFLDIQIQADIPGYSNTSSAANLTPYLGDGSTDFTGGLIGGVPILVNKSNAFSAQAGAGYTYRTLNFSGAIPWTGRFLYKPYKDGITVSVGIVGLTSLKTDPNASSPSTVALARSSTGIGGNFFVGGINPSLMTIQGSIGYKFDEDTEVNIYGAQSIWGQAAPIGFTGALGVQTRMGGGKTKNPVYMTPTSYGHANRGFLNYSLDAHVLKSNDRLNLVKINKGSQDGVEVGQLFDIFYVKKDGTMGDAIARGQVTSVNLEEGALDIIEYYREVWIDEGFIAKRVIQAPKP